ncbi:MAG: hypothetical protein JNK85_09455 [Verrucomicrobiales bacterium]|nr:hypothetical protein [Verrucomicrobiales bacterium]
MTWSDVVQPPTRRVLRQFAGLLAAIPLLLFLVATVRAGGLPTHRPWMLAIGGAVLAIGLLGTLRPGLVRWPFTVAMLVAFPIGFVVSQVVLAVVFYVVFLAVGLGLRAKGRDAMVRQRRAAGVSYWERKPQTRDPASYLRQY